MSHQHDLEGARQVVAAGQRILDTIAGRMAQAICKGGKADTERLHARGGEAFVFARHLAEHVAARQMCAYAEQVGGELEAGLACVYAAEAAAALSGSLRFSERRFGLEPADLAPLDAHAGFIAAALDPEAVSRLGDLILDRDRDQGGSYALDDEHKAIRDTFASFSDDRVAPIAEHTHRHDEIIPEDLLQALAELGVFGISIPEEYGGSYVDHLTMVLATEELTRGSLGIGGGVITRPEICAKALLAGGSEEQKRKWFPLIASGKRIVSVAVTEPNAGSDVAAVSCVARKVPGGYTISGEKTWATFAGRADTFVLLARTGDKASGYKGLTLFLVEKPPTIGSDGQYEFQHTQPGGAAGSGTCEGRAIPTIGYRGMHSFAVSFADYFVPEENRIGAEGQGFILQMQGFAGGRIQTAARAVGLMEVAFREAIKYVRERAIFGKHLQDFPLTKRKLVQMGARTQAGRQLAYHVAALMDQERGGLEASLVKLMTCRDAEVVTREAMQLHGGMGYSEEYPVSRFWQDARVLSIFEGAEEVLAILVIARQAFEQAARS